MPTSLVSIAALDSLWRLIFRSRD